MKYLPTLFILSTFTIFSGEIIKINIHNISHNSVTIYYQDITGHQERKIKKDTYMMLPIQKSPDHSNFLLSLKIGNKLKYYMTPAHCAYRQFTINPDPGIKKNQKLKRKKRKIRFT
jgi:hypothetical protein